MQTIIEIGLSNAFMATVLALFATGVGVFCRRPALRHTLWLLVLLKLITPPLMSVPVPWPEVFEPAWVIPALEPSLAETDGGKGEDILPSDGGSLFAPAREGWNHLAWLEEKSSLHASGLKLDRSFWLAASCALWISGCLIWSVLVAVRLLRFHQLLRLGRPADARLQEQAKLLAQRLGLARCPHLWVVPGRVSPLLWASPLGTVYLIFPADLWDDLQPEQQDTLLAHELAHARRHDYWVRWLELVATGLYWWLPVTWWARREIQRAEEECCDSWVVLTLPKAAKAYAKALLQTVDFLDARPSLPPVASGIGHVHYLKRRLTMIMRKPLYPQLSWPLRLGAIVLALFVLPIAPQRLEAQGSATELGVELSDETAVALDSQDESNRDLERRLRRLEERMDRLLDKLETGPAKQPPAETPRASRGIGLDGKVKEAGNKPSRFDQPKEKKGRTEVDGKTMSPEEVKRLQQEMQQKIQKAIDPERMKQLQQKIQDAVNKSIDPERMKDLQKRIEDAVNRGLNAERMEALSRKIEEAAKKSAEKEKLKESKARAAAPAPARAPEMRRAPAPSRSVRAERTPDSQPQDLDRRLDNLEKKMDRVLQALESSRKQVR